MTSTSSNAIDRPLIRLADLIIFQRLLIRGILAQKFVYILQVCTKALILIEDSNYRLYEINIFESEVWSMLSTALAGTR